MHFLTNLLKVLLIFFGQNVIKIKTIIIQKAYPSWVTQHQNKQQQKN